MLGPLNIGPFGGLWLQPIQPPLLSPLPTMGADTLLQKPCFRQTSDIIKISLRDLIVADADSLLEYGLWCAIGVEMCHGGPWYCDRGSCPGCLLGATSRQRVRSVQAPAASSTNSTSQWARRDVVTWPTTCRRPRWRHF